MPIVNTTASDPNTTTPTTGSTPPPHVMDFNEFRASQPTGAGGADTRYQSYLGGHGLQAIGSIMTNQYNIGAIPTATDIKPGMGYSAADVAQGGQKPVSEDVVKTQNQALKGYIPAGSQAISPNAPVNTTPILGGNQAAYAQPGKDYSGVSSTDQLASRTQDLIKQGLYTPEMQRAASVIGHQLQGQGAGDVNSPGAVALRAQQPTQTLAPPTAPLAGITAAPAQPGVTEGVTPPVSPTEAPTATIASSQAPANSTAASAPTAPQTQSTTMAAPAAPVASAPAISTPGQAPAGSTPSSGGAPAPVSAPPNPAPTYQSADGTVQNGTPSSLVGLLKQYGLNNFDPSQYTSSESSMKVTADMLAGFKSQIADKQYQDFLNIANSHSQAYQDSYLRTIDSAKTITDLNIQGFQNQTNLTVANNNVQQAQLTAERDNQMAIVNNKNAHLEGYLKGSLAAMGVDPASTAGITYMAAQTNMALLNASQIAASYNTPIVQLQNSTNNVMAQLATNVAKEHANYTATYNQRTDALNNQLMQLDEKVFSSEQARDEAKTQAVTDWSNSNIKADASRDQRVQQWNQIAFQTHQQQIQNYNDVWGKYVAASPYMISYNPSNPDQMSYLKDSSGKPILTATGIQREIMMGRYNNSIWGNPNGPSVGTDLPSLPGQPSSRVTGGTLRTGVQFSIDPVTGAVKCPTGAIGGDCGAFTGDLDGHPGEIPSDIAGKLALVTTQTPAVGMNFSMNSSLFPANGHSGRVVGLNSDGTVEVTDSNWAGDGKVQTHSVPLSTITAGGGGFFNPIPAPEQTAPSASPQKTVTQQKLDMQQQRLDQSTTRIEAAAGKTITADPIVKRYEAALPSFNEIQADAKAPLNSISSMKLLDLYTRINTGQGVNQYNISGILQGSSLSDTAQRSIMQMFSSGGELSATQKKELLEAATSSMVSLQNDYQNTLKSYQDVNKARGIDTSKTAPDLSLTVGRNVPTPQTGTFNGLKYTTTTPTPSETVKMTGKAGTKWEGKTYVVPRDKIGSYTTNGFDITQ